jgi:hypothetical protein
MDKKVFLTCTSVWYYSATDEAFFFAWIDKIPSIKTSNGIKDDLFLHFANNDIPDNDLREIIALFYRYKVDMKQLQIFLNDSNKEWFKDNKRAFWHRRVWSNESSKKS